jgi:alkanesulfonate monooxygenase SsuD/methylene tetrahydromethanopterin reductase-like flavin-dependent oxidoreductase (luciferase family)
MQALQVYRDEFRPSAALAAPHVMVGVPALAAATDDEAEYLATTMYQRSLGILRGQRTALLPPVRSMEEVWSRAEALAVAERMALMVVGSPQRVREGLQQIIESTEADELILVSDAYDPADRRRSFELLMESKKVSETISHPEAN